MILEGRPVVEFITKDQIVRLSKFPRRLCLAIFADMEHPASHQFVQRKMLYAAQIGVDVNLTDLSQITKEQGVQAVKNCEADGIIVQLPVPQGHNSTELISYIPPHKDVDGFHPLNLGKALSGNIEVVGCTALAVSKFIDYYIGDITGSHIVIINDTLVLGKPLLAVLNAQGATVSLCNKYTKNLFGITQTADIIVSAVGHKDFDLSQNLLYNRPTVIDVACRVEGKKVFGDLPQDHQHYTKSFSPVPGGIGPITVCCVLENLIRLMEIYGNQTIRA
jgi:methylenetetrahydrofolate dehydrogenase (NADP+)/methenyltetrahydrofolate cyclohydrolase